jgi:hypothetical protein
MTREILLPATSGRISVTQFDVLDSDRPRDAACDKRDVCQGRAVLRLERDARGKAEANLALCGEVDAVLTPAHPGRLRSSQRRTAKNHPIFRNSRRPRGGLGAHDTRQYAGRHRVSRRVRWSLGLSAGAAEIVDLTIAGVLPREGAMIASDALAGLRCQPVRRSRGTESRITSPSGFQSREISPPNWPAAVARTRKSPNPALPMGEGIGGPPSSVQEMTTAPARSAQWIWIRPAVAESAPYFTELVANSFSSSARLEITDPEISISQPTIESRRFSPSPR